MPMHNCSTLEVAVMSIYNFKISVKSLEAAKIMKVGSQFNAPKIFKDSNSI